MASKRYSGAKRKQLISESGGFARVWLLCFVPLYLLLPGSRGFAGISPFKTHLFYALAAPMLLWGGFVLCRRVFVRSAPSARLSGMQIAALFYLGFTLLSAALSPHKGLAWYCDQCHETALTICIYVMLYLCIARSRAYDPRLGTVFLVSMTGFCAISLLQLLGANPLGLYPSGLTYSDGYGVKYSGAFLGTMGNVDLVSVFLCAVIPILTLMFLRLRGGRRWWALGLGLASLVILLWIYVLCGFVGLAVGAVVSGFVLLPKTRRGHLIYGGCVLLLAIGAVVLLSKWDPPLGFLHELHEILNGRILDKFGSGRIFIWRQLLERIPGRLWTGIGPDTVRHVDLMPFQRLDESGAVVAQAKLTDAHCLALQILFCQGLPALLSWLAMLAFALRRWWKGRHNLAVAAVGAALVCWVVAMLFSFSSIILQPWFWVLLGLLEAIDPARTA